MRKLIGAIIGGIILLLVVAIYGAFGGLAVGIVRDWSGMVHGDFASSLVYLVGSAVGGAALVALASGARNLFIRSN